MVKVKNKDVSCLEKDKKSDVYSFAITMFEVITLKRAWSDTQRANIALFVTTGMRPTFPDTVFTNDTLSFLAMMVSKCWEQDAMKRPSFREIIKMIETRAKVQ